MSVRQDKVQISIAFITDESKAFAKLVEDNKKFIRDIQEAKNKGQDLTATIQKMAESGKAIANIPLDKLAPAQLILRAQQLKQVLSLIPQSAPEYKQLEAEYKKINDQLAEMRTRTKGVSQAMNEARTDGGSFFNSLTSFAGRALIAFYALKQIASALFKPSQLASEMEQATIAFETMLGSARKARALVNEVIKLAATTPFEQAELIDYTKRLLAMGIESKKLIPTLTSLGDIAAGVGREKLPQIVLAFGQVATKTKLAGGELKQFTEAGVPLIEALAKQLNVSEKEIFKLTEAGKIGFKDVEKAIQSLTTEGGKFAGLMGKQAQTTQGLFSTLKDNVNLALTAFGEGFNIALKEILKSSTAFTNGLDRQKIRDFGEAVGKAVKFLYDFTPALLKLIAVFATFKVISAAQTALQGFLGAMRASETVQLIFNSGLANTIKLQTLVNRLFTVSAIPIWGAAIVAATLAVQALTQRMTALSESQKDLNQLQIDGAKSAREEIQSSSDLFAIIREGSSTYDQRNKAVKQLLETYPEYLGTIKTENGLLNNLDEAQRRVNQGIIESAFARIKAAEIEKRGSERIAREIEAAQATEVSNAANKNRDETSAQTLITSAPSFDRKTAATITAGREAAKLQEILDRNRAKDEEDLSYFKHFDSAALGTAKVLIQNVSPSWKYLNTQIEETKKLLLKDPSNEGLKKQLVDFELQKSKEKNSLFNPDKKKDTPDGPDKAAEDKARAKAIKAAKDELDRIKTETQKSINEVTIKRLNEKKIEKDFEVELLQIREAGFQKELDFLAKPKNNKILPGEFEKTEAEKLKLQRQIRDRKDADELTALDETSKKRQTILELQAANGLITEGEYKVRTLEITRGTLTERLAILKTQGKETTEEYAKTLLDQARTTRQIETQTLDNSLVNIKNSTAKELETLEIKYQSGKISEATYQEEKLKITIQGIDAQLAALAASGNQETDLFRQLSLQKIKAQHDEIERQIDVALEGIHRLGEAEQQALADKLEAGRISRNQYDLIQLNDKELALRQELAILKAYGDATIAQQKKVESEITKVVKDEAEKKRAIERDNQRARQEIIGASSAAFRDILQFEIDSLSKNEQARKQNAQRLKNLQRAQIVIDGASEIAKIWLNSSALPPPFGQILGGILTVAAIARTASSLSKVDATKFARGGFTGAGNPRMVDETGHTPVGVVHNDEWVGPKWMTQNPALRPVFNMMENIRVRGYADGGFVNTTPTVSFSQPTITNSINFDIGSLVAEFKGLRDDVRNWQTRLKADVYRDEFDAQAARDNDDRARAAI